ncbi:MFS transporter [Plantactinospora sp. KLBMP9567]|uniref:MFS transporter n=1 Tax=Plantactinospora sp. KLBMP9567 TaxID=3085900 RepID=UPI00298152B8|nr:MFS transporter [Plantactinospora sp. KLBMP9567]MDW5324755.1 MFS transporter [Plantactinospora sp. KLBMP9567]
MPPLSLDDPAALRRGRVAVSLLFLLFGMAIGTWTARIPAVKEELGLTDGQLSVGLLGLAAGAITGMQLTGRLVDRYGSARVMLPVAFAEGGCLLLPGYAVNLATLAGALFVFGTVHGTLNIAMNANAVEVERARRRPMLSSCHAVYSIGGFLGAAIGGLFARADADVTTTFWTTALVALGLAAWAARWALPQAGHAATPPAAPSPPAAAPTITAPSAGVPEPAGERRSGERREPPGVLFLGVLAFCCLVGEGAAADWSTVYLRDSLGSGPGFAAAAFAAFSIMMTAGRLVGDRLAAALGPVVLVRGCGILAAVGLGGALLVDHPVAGLLGFGCLGAGLSCIAPQVFSAAGNRNPSQAGRALARVAGLGYLGFLVGPVVIGGAAELIGLPRALALPALLALFVALAAGAVRPRPGRPHPAEPVSSDPQS